jgi:hypothetical protein
VKTNCIQDGVDEDVFCPRFGFGPDVSSGDISITVDDSLDLMGVIEFIFEFLKKVGKDISKASNCGHVV